MFLDYFSAIFIHVWIQDSPDNKNHSWILSKLLLNSDASKLPGAELMNGQFLWGFLRILQTWGFCMDFLNHRKGDTVFYQVFLLSPLQCIVTHWRNCQKLREFEEIKISRQRCRGDFEWQGGKLLRLLSGFRPRIRPWWVEGWTDWNSPTPFNSWLMFMF